jgi:hypothetical protein
MEPFVSDVQTTEEVTIVDNSQYESSTFEGNFLSQNLVTISNLNQQLVTDNLPAGRLHNVSTLP